MGIAPPAPASSAKIRATALDVAVTYGYINRGWADGHWTTPHAMLGSPCREIRLRRCN